MVTTKNYYKESTENNAKSIIIASVSVMVSEIVIGYFYGSLVALVPFIYITVVLTLGLGMAIGVLVRLIARIAHIRGKRNLIVLSVYLIVLTYYFHWITYLCFLENLNMPTTDLFIDKLFWIFDPNFSFFSFIGQILKEGTWSIAGIQFTGVLLGLVWLLEFGIMAVLPIRSVFERNIFPYSDQQQKWYPKFSLSDQFEVVSSKSHLVKGLDNGVLEFMKSLDYGQGWLHIKFHLYLLEGESQQYLSIEKITVADKGKGKTSSSYIVTNYPITSQEARRILDGYHHSKERFELF